MNSVCVKMVPVSYEKESTSYKVHTHLKSTEMNLRLKSIKYPKIIKLENE